MSIRSSGRNGDVMTALVPSIETSILKSLSLGAELLSHGNKSALSDAPPMNDVWLRFGLRKTVTPDLIDPTSTVTSDPSPTLR